MAKVRSFEVDAEVTVLLELDESEVRALEGIFGYNVESFLKVFYEKMGRTYVEPYEKGVRSLHATIRQQLGKPIRAVGQARSALYQAAKQAEGK